MVTNQTYRKLAQQLLDDEIDDGEFAARILEETVHAYSTTFWCTVMRARESHDYGGDL